MKKDISDWLGQGNEYGLAACNISHDINNSLAILMGYSENLEYMIETDKIDKNDLQEICDKLFYAIDKLNAQSRQVASDRKKDYTQKFTNNLSEYFHRWIKVQTPQFKRHGIIPSFTTGKEFITKQLWSEVNYFFCEVFCHILQDVSLEEPKKMELSTDFDDNKFYICFEKLSGMNFQNLPSIKGTEVSFEEKDGWVALHLTCFSQEQSTQSAA